MNKYSIITGPTACGKTNLSHNLFDDNLANTLINADSRQFYQFFNIGTAKPPPKEIKKYNYHLIDFLSPNKRFNAYEFQKKAQTILDKSSKTIVVGGSPFYVHSLLHNIPHHPSIPKEQEQLVEELFQQKGIEYLQKELKNKDEEYFKKVDLHNHKRLIRALTYIFYFNKKYSDFRKQLQVSSNHPLIFVIHPNRERLYLKIEERVDKMIEQGLVNEVSSLIEMGFNKELPASNSIGYREVFDFLDKTISHEEMVALIKQNTRHFAKKQMTWFKKFRGVIFLVEEDKENNQFFKDFNVFSHTKKNIKKLIKDKINFKLYYNGNLKTITKELEIAISNYYEL